jgi:hypothetical protein
MEDEGSPVMHCVLVEMVEWPCGRSHKLPQQTDGDRETELDIRKGISGKQVLGFE